MFCQVLFGMILIKTEPTKKECIWIEKNLQTSGLGMYDMISICLVSNFCAHTIPSSRLSYLELQENLETT